jgi:DegV family protein with EDD domain
MDAREIAIVTDSTSDIPAELVKEFDIAVVPHTIIWGNEQYCDRVNLQPEEFYKRVQSGGELPTTAQATEQQFLQTYMDLIKKGYRQIVVITLSNRLSGAIQSAANAAKAIDYPVQIIDSLNVTMGYGWQVLAAARLRDLGGNVQQILDQVNNVRKSISLYVCMDTMAYLRHGGRIGDAARLLGTMLNIKPVVKVSNTRGVVEEVGMARTYQKAIDIMYTKFFETMDLTKKMHVAVMHGNAADQAEKLIQRIRDEFHPAEILTSITGPVLGLNTGPGALALAGYTED